MSVPPGPPPPPQWLPLDHRGPGPPWPRDHHMAAPAATQADQHRAGDPRHHPRHRVRAGILLAMLAFSSIGAGRPASLIRSSSSVGAWLVASLFHRRDRVPENPAIRRGTLLDRDRLDRLVGAVRPHRNRGDVALNPAAIHGCSWVGGSVAAAVFAVEAWRRGATDERVLYVVTGALVGGARCSCGWAPGPSTSTVPARTPPWRVSGSTATGRSSAAFVGRGWACTWQSACGLPHAHRGPLRTRGGVGHGRRPGGLPA